MSSGNWPVGLVLARAIRSSSIARLRQRRRSWTSAAVADKRNQHKASQSVLTQPEAAVFFPERLDQFVAKPRAAFGAGAVLFNGEYFVSFAQRGDHRGLRVGEAAGGVFPQVGSGFVQAGLVDTREDGLRGA